MWLINIKTFIKHLLKHKLYTLITVMGFATSLTFVILLSVYLKNELSVNSSQVNKDRIYRLTNEKFSNFAPPIGSLLQSKFPEIESFTRIYTHSAFINVPKSDKMVDFHSLLADSTFFNIFTVPLIEGDKNTVLKTKSSIVLSKEFANKFYGNKSPVGKQITIYGRVTATITGVYDKLPENTHFSKVDGIMNFKLLSDLWQWEDMESDYGNCSFDLYLLTKPHTNLPSKAPQILKLFKKDFWIYKKEIAKEVIFEPLQEVYFSELSGRGIEQNSKTLVSVLLIIVFLILVLSIINYMNLTIAQAGTRAKDIAIRKLVGSSRIKLVLQHITESVILISIAFAIAIFLSFLAENTFNNLLETKLRLENVFTFHSFFISLLFIILIGFISGIIPSLIITKLKAIDIVKGSFIRKNKAIYSRILIGFQYVVVITLIISTIVISKQTKFMISKDLGFNKTNIIKLPYYIENSQQEGLKSELNKIPGVKNVSYVRGTPIDGGNNNSFTYEEKPVSFQVFEVDSTFFDMMNFKIQPTGVSYAKNGIWLNRTAVKGLGLDSLPKNFIKQGETLPVLGVIDDFHFRSLNQEIGMLMIYQLESTGNPWNILVQIDGKNIVETTNKIKEAYWKFSEGIPLEFEFFDQKISSWYNKEKRMATIIKYFAILSIIISVMGIFAMSVFYNQQKIKEIGVRKVNGATVFEIIKMLNKDFIKWVVIAFIIAAPIAYYAMNKWLDNFAYKIELSWWIFALAGFAAMLVALITVSWNTFVSARKNPVKSLKYE